MTDKRKSKKTQKAAAIETEKAENKKAKAAKGKKSKGAVQTDEGGESDSDLVVDGEDVVKIMYVMNRPLSLPEIRLTTSSAGRKA